MNRRLRGFSLLEVVLVLAILLVLAGIVFAASGPVRENVRRAQCVSNLHRLSQAFELYRQDFHGSDPLPGQPANYVKLGLPPAGQLPIFFNDYVKDRSVLFCPSYHGEHPLEKIGSTYGWYDCDEPVRPLSYRFSQVVRQHGLKTPVLTCREHNAIWDLSREPRWEMKTVILLRLNGRVDTIRVPVRSDSHTW